MVMKICKAMYGIEEEVMKPPSPRISLSNTTTLRVKEEREEKEKIKRKSTPPSR